MAHLVAVTVSPNMTTWTIKFESSYRSIDIHPITLFYDDGTQDTIFAPPHYDLSQMSRSEEDPAPDYVCPDDCGTCIYCRNTASDEDAKFDATYNPQYKIYPASYICRGDCGMCSDCLSYANEQQSELGAEIKIDEDEEYDD